MTDMEVRMFTQIEDLRAEVARLREAIRVFASCWDKIERDEHRIEDWPTYEQSIRTLRDLAREGK